MDKRKKKKRKKTVNNINKSKIKHRKKRKKSPRLLKIFKLIFRSTYNTLISLRLIGKGSNKLATIGVCLILIFAIFFVTNKNSYQILVDNVLISTIERNIITEEDFINNSNAMLASRAGTNVLLNEDITFKPVNTLRRNRITVEQALRNVSNVLTYKVEAGIITVNGEEIVTVASVNEANEVYDELINKFIPQGVNILNRGFMEDVEIRRSFVDSEEVSSKETALRMLSVTTQEIQNYEIRQGDVLGSIAAFADMTLDELLELNEGLTLNTPIRQGEHLVISMSVPLLTVVTEEEFIVTKSTPYGVERVYNEGQHVSFSRVIQPGVEGQVRETYIITRINGEEIKRELEAKEVISLPTNQIIESGSRQG